MALDANEIVVGTTGSLWVADTDATAPDDVATAMGTVDTDWIHLGFIGEDGATIADSKEVSDVKGWQSFYSLRKIITGRDFTIAAELLQWNAATVPFALGGGTVASNGPEWTYTPPAPSLVDERSLVLEWSDDDKHYRFYLPKGMVQETVESQLVRTDAAVLPITFGVIAEDDVDPYTLFTDDPSFAFAS